MQERRKGDLDDFMRGDLTEEGHAPPAYSSHACCMLRLSLKHDSNDPIDLTFSFGIDDFFSKNHLTQP